MSAWRGWRLSIVVALATYAVYRAITELVALFAMYGLQFPNVVRGNPSALLLPWSHWDAGLYQLVTNHGYGGPDTGLVAFAPVLPALMKATAVVFHVSALTAGILVANVALVLALALLHRLVSEEHGSGVATASVVLLLVWPSSFFLGAPYTESLCLLFAVCAFFAARRQRWFLAGIFVALLVMTKFWLVVILAALLWQRWERRGDRRRMARDAAVLVAPAALAMIGWALYMRRLTGDPLAFAHAQASFGRHFAWPWDLARREIGLFVHLNFLDSTAASAAEPFDLTATLMVAAMAVWWWRQRRRDYAIWLGLAFAVFVCETLLMGEVRETLILFPVFVGLAILAQRRAWVERLVTAVALPGGVFLLSRFVAEKFAG